MREIRHQPIYSPAQALKSTRTNRSVNLRELKHYFMNVAIHGSHSTSCVATAGRLVKLYCLCAPVRLFELHDIICAVGSRRSSQ